jgi:hypothetical protein
MLADLLSGCFAADLEETWERERTATPVRAFAVRLHATGCSLRETTTILASLGVNRSHGAVWNWVHQVADSVPDPPEAQPKRVAVDETAVKINGELSVNVPSSSETSRRSSRNDTIGRHANGIPSPLSEIVRVVKPGRESVGHSSVGASR